MSRKWQKKVMEKLKEVVENDLSQFSTEEGVTLADSVETLGVDLRTRVKRLGAKEKARRKKCNVRFSIIKKNKAFQKKLHESGCQEIACGVGDRWLRQQAKRAQLRFPCSWRHMALKLKILNAGQK